MVKSYYTLGTALICVYGVEESEVLTQELHNVFISKIYLWDIDQRASRILKQIFEYVNRKFFLRIQKIKFFLLRLGVVVQMGELILSMFINRYLLRLRSAISFFLIFISLNSVSPSC